jgi:beta-fructofuranosidase
VSFRFHYAPAAGWLNDPNGLITWNGRHHLFYQHNPAGITQEGIGWGHASSADLISWQEHPLALRPGSDRTRYDADGCYSGCAAIADDGIVHFLYTGVAGEMQLPCLATSADPNLEILRKDPDNPIIRSWPLADVTALRDHTVRRAGSGWHQGIGGQTGTLGGAVFGYVSSDLRHWRFDQVVLDSTRCDVPDSVWECPDLFDTAAGTVLVVSILDLSRPFTDAVPLVWYVCGDWSGGRLEPRQTARLDYGDRFYAPQSYSCGDRRLQFGWIRTDLDPSATGPSLGAMSAPRELSVRGDRLRSSPAPELARLRRDPVRAQPARGASGTTITLDRATAVELAVDERELDLRAVHLVSDLAGRRFDIDLTELPRLPHREDDAAFTLLFDHGIIEVFRGGTPATWTDLALTALTRIELGHAPASRSAMITAWPLD